jgi:dimethylsulfone monooxygenase
VTLDLEIENGQRAAMGSANRLKLGLFGANYSSGRAVTTVPERWSGSLPDCVRPAQMADRAGIEFMLPIGRWKGYDGDTDYQGATWETVAWAYGLLAKTERLTVFGTVNAPLIPPLIAAKEFVAADTLAKDASASKPGLLDRRPRDREFGLGQSHYPARGMRAC